MDWMTFVTKLVEAVAWPALIAGVLIWLRGPIVELATALRSAKYKDLELNFGKKLQEAEIKAERASLPDVNVRPTRDREGSETSTFGDYVERLAPISPRAAISETWTHVEHRMRAAVNKNGPSGPFRVMDVARQLQRDGLLPVDAVSLLDDLRALRNRAVHAEDMALEPQQAIEFARLAERVLASIPPNAATPAGRAT